MTRRARLDAELVRRGLARSREQAAELVAAGQVRVPGRATVKAATQVAAGDPIVVAEPAGETFVSRGGHKLAGALDAFGPLGLVVGGRRVLDAGASTGGFTDVALRRGARAVVCVDVGYGQLAWSLQTDERVRVLDRTNVRDLTLDAIGEPVDLVVADLSFIPLRLVLPALAAVMTPVGDLVPMVKPQFEVGREALGAGGVVREPARRADAVAAVASFAHQELGLGVAGVVASPLPGPAGNVEYFLWLRRDAPPLDRTRLDAAVAAGPA
jgi:23S rRNA (cytidine1920-2'-O)/16S rRNA (cytidine1409-2'-O)-methyltransferase